MVEIRAREREGIPIAPNLLEKNRVLLFILKKKI
jgi:hypothetical protein